MVAQEKEKGVQSETGIGGMGGGTLVCPPCPEENGKGKAKAKTSGKKGKDGKEAEEKAEEKAVATITTPTNGSVRGGILADEMGMGKGISLESTNTKLNLPLFHFSYLTAHTSPVSPLSPHPSLHIPHPYPRKNLANYLPDCV